MNILFIPIHLLLLFIVAMSTESNEGVYSVFVLQDIFSLFTLFFEPFILFAIFHSIPIIMFLFAKDFNFKLKLYLVLVFIVSLPFSLVLFSEHANTSLEYKSVREKEVLISKGYMVEGTYYYDICNRYLDTTDENKLKSLLELDSTILSYDFHYITNYMDYIQFIDTKVAIKRLEDYFGVDYIENYPIVFDKSLLELSKILTKSRLKSETNANTIHTRLNTFLLGKSDDTLDGYTIDDDLERTIPLMVTFENIKLLNDIKHISNKGSYIQELYLRSELEFTKTRVKQFIEGNAYDYQYGYDKTIKDNKLYNDYLSMLDTLLEQGSLNAKYVKNILDEFNKVNSLNVNDRELTIMQIFFNPITLEEIKLQNKKD